LADPVCVNIATYPMAGIGKLKIHIRMAGLGPDCVKT